MLNVNRDTYLFQIDKYGDISAHLDECIRAHESYNNMRKNKTGAPSLSIDIRVYE